MKKKILSLIMATAMIFSVTGCGDDSDTSSEDGTYKIGICQLVQHDALDAATKGFKQALKDEFGDKVSFDEQNAQNDSATCTTIINSLVSKKVDLILANTTTALQAAANGTADIPILGTSVTEYGVALSIDDFDGTVGGNISGTSDLPPLEKQADMVKELFPDAKKVGLLYCSAEPNSKYQADTVKDHLEDMGYECSIYTFSDSNDISAVVTKAASDSDVMYVPTDNTAASNTELIDSICSEKKVPVVAGEEGIASVCGVATLSISYYDLGYSTGKMAIKILKDGGDISKMPIEYAPNFVKKYNESKCKDYGITIPEGYEPIKAK